MRDFNCVLKNSEKLNGLAVRPYETQDFFGLLLKGWSFKYDLYWVFLYLDKQFSLGQT